MNMAGQIQFWIEAFEQLLEERSGAPWTVTHEVTEPRLAPLFLSTIAITCAEPAELRISLPSGDLVQLVQLATRQPADPQAPLDEAVHNAWKSLLEAALPAFLQRLQSEGTGEYHVEISSMRAAEPGELDASAAAEVEPAQAYTLRNGEIALSMRLHAVRSEAADQPTQPEAAQSEIAQPDVELGSAPATEAEPVENPAQTTEQAQAEAAAERRARQAEADRIAAEEMERAAAEAEERAAWRRTDAAMDESSPFRTHPERLNLLLDIELEATLRFGALEMPLRKVLELGPGDVLQLDRHVQEPVDLVVGDRIVARGEVVLVGGNFGLHVTEVAEPRRRLDSIRALF
jgi:flagellar motor switch protein FliN/FliY